METIFCSKFPKILGFRAYVQQNCFIVWSSLMRIFHTDFVLLSHKNHRKTRMSIARPIRIKNNPRQCIERIDAIYVRRHQRGLFVENCFHRLGFELRGGMCIFGLQLRVVIIVPDLQPYERRCGIPNE